MKLDRCGVREIPWRLGFTNHDGQDNRGGPSVEGDVLLELETKLGVVRVIGLGARFEIHGAVFGVGL